MNLYFTDSIGFSKPGQALIRAVSAEDAIQKISEFITNYPQYQLFKTKMVPGCESDEIDFDIKLEPLTYESKSNNTPDIDIIDGGGLNQDPPVGGMHIS